MFTGIKFHNGGEAPLTQLSKLVKADARTVYEALGSEDVKKLLKESPLEDRDVIEKVKLELSKNPNIKKSKILGVQPSRLERLFPYLFPSKKRFIQNTTETAS